MSKHHTILIFASGSGTNAEQIIRHFSPINDVKVAGVYTNNPSAFVTERAKELDIPTFVFSREQLNDPNALLAELKGKTPNLIVLAGFLKKIPEKIVDLYRNKIVNIHPSLLPKYAGGINNNVHRDVLKNKDSETGCTIHYVTANVDSGPILIQKKCEVQPGDTIESLKDRVQHLEGQAFIEALHLIENKNYA